MATALTKPLGGTRQKAKKNTVNSSQPVTPVKIVSASATGSVLSVTFDLPFALVGVPKYTTDIAGADAVSVAMTGPLTIAITYDAPVAAATVLNIPFEDKAVRHASGGFVSTSTFPV